VARRDYEKAVRVPPELQAELERAGSLGYRAWLSARAENDFSIMLPHFERNLELRRRYVECFSPAGDPYDVVLDDYEPGMKTAAGCTSVSSTRSSRARRLATVSRRRSTRRRAACGRTSSAGVPRPGGTSIRCSSASFPPSPTCRSRRSSAR